MRTTRFPTRTIAIAIALSVPWTAHANDDIPLLQPEERQAVEQQTDAFHTALQPSLAQAARSTVRIWSGKTRLAYGTVAGDGTRVLTKWSQVAASGSALLVEGAGGATRSASIAGVYEDEDLAVLEIVGAPLPAVRWVQGDLPLGTFVAMPQPDGRPAAFGVVSVAARNLRETDQAFLGILGDRAYQGAGVKVDNVEKGSGAEAAGIRSGDLILRVGQREISGLLELRNSLMGTQPGETVQVVVRRGGREETLEVRLGNRPKLAQFDGERLDAMKRMGGPISQVADEFPSAVQTDMRPRPDQIGGPVVNLRGEVVGISLARADRTRSFFMPSAEVESLLARPSQDPKQARTREPDAFARRSMPLPSGREIEGAPRHRRPSEERLREHLSEMQQLMDFMRREMEMIEEER